MISSKRNKIGVVGGGTAGIVSSLLLAERTDSEIHLIERNDCLGGLCRSTPSGFREDVHFDNGSRFLVSSGIEELDQILTGGICSESLLTFEKINSASYFSGKLNAESSLLDASALPKETYENGLRDFESAVRNQANRGLGDFDNLEQQLRNEFGQTFTEKIFAPIIRKFQRHELNELAQNAHEMNGLRFVDCQSRSLFEELLANKGIKGPPPKAKNDKKLSIFYPSRGGTSHWIGKLQDKLELAGVKLSLGSSLSKIVQLQNGPLEMTFSGKSTDSFDQVIWTGPRALLLKQMGLLPEKKRPSFRMASVKIAHLLLDRPADHEIINFIVHDHELLPWRITCYGAIPGLREDGLWPVTAEILSDSPSDKDIPWERIVEELKVIGVIAPDSKLLERRPQFIPNAFPPPSLELRKWQQVEKELSRDIPENISVPNQIAATDCFRAKVAPTTYRNTIDFIESILDDG
jgi:protoporphyrinogen oxidase